MFKKAKNTFTLQSKIGCGCNRGFSSKILGCFKICQNYPQKISVKTKNNRLQRVSNHDVTQNIYAVSKNSLPVSYVLQLS